MPEAWVKARDHSFVFLHTFAQPWLAFQEFLGISNHDNTVWLEPLRKKDHEKFSQHVGEMLSLQLTLQDIPWDEIAEKAKSMGVSMKEAAKSVPWQEIADKAKAMGVSMKEAAMDMGLAIKDKLDDIPWDEIAEKAKATGVSMKEAAVAMGISIKERVEDRKVLRESEFVW